MWIRVAACCLFITVGLPRTQGQLADGLYLVVEAFESRPDELQEDDLMLIQYNYRIIDSTQQRLRYFAVDPGHMVPLILDRDPERVVQPDDRYHLLLTLGKKGGRQLKRLTRKYTGERVSLVIGGEAVTLHRIREPITGRGLQITRCTDDACRYLFYELRDNVQ